MKLAIMQPYFFPYIGYFQLINAVDKFVLYDNIEYTKKGWINRNRLLFNNNIEYFSINLKKDSDYLTIKERAISEIYFEKEMPKIIRKIQQYYSKAYYFDLVYPTIKNIFENREMNLYNYLMFSINQIISYLGIKTEVIISSNVRINHDLKKEEKIYEICNYFKTNNYLNPIGGISLYSKEQFKSKGINLLFIKSKEITYNQNNKNFVPNLSIIDVLMYNSKEEIKLMLNQYELV